VIKPGADTCYTGRDTVTRGRAGIEGAPEEG